jgi:hypothetical protein
MHHLEVGITDVDAKSNWSKAFDKVLATHEHKKMKKYLKDDSVGQCQHFSPFVVSMNGLLGKEAKLC